VTRSSTKLTRRERKRQKSEGWKRKAETLNEGLTIKQVTKLMISVSIKQKERRKRVYN